MLRPPLPFCRQFRTRLDLPLSSLRLPASPFSIDNFDSHPSPLVTYLMHVNAHGGVYLLDDGAGILISHVHPRNDAEIAVLPYFLSALSSHHEATTVTLSTILSLLLEIPPSSPQAVLWLPRVIQAMENDVLLKSYPSLEVTSLRVTALALLAKPTREHHEQLVRLMEDLPPGELLPRNVVNIVMSRLTPTLLQRVLDDVRKRLPDTESTNVVFPKTFCPEWAKTIFRGLFHNEHFERSAVEFVELHRVMLYAIRSFPTRNSPEIATTYLLVLAKVYARRGRCPEFFEVFNVLIEVNPYLRLHVPLAVLNIMIVLPLRHFFVSSKSKMREQCWEWCLQSFRTALQFFPEPANVTNIVKVAINVATQLDGRSADDMTYDRLIQLCAVMRELNVLGSGAPGVTARATVELVIPRTIREMRVLSEASFGTLMRLVEDITPPSPFRVMDMALIIFVALAEKSCKGDAQTKSMATHLGRLVQAWYQRRLAVVGAQLNVINYSPIAVVLVKLSLREAPAFMWTCGCGSENVDASPSCWHCLRATRSHWVCNKCNHNHTSRSDQCKECSFEHPWRTKQREHSLWFCTFCRTLSPSGEPKCRSCGSDGERKESLCMACGKINWRGFYTCYHCGEPGKAIQASTLSLWHCGVCARYNLNNVTMCKGCEKVGVKSPKPSTGVHPIPYFQWECGCGAKNSPTRHDCMNCRSALAKYTCPGCSKQVVLSSRKMKSASGVVYKIVSCEGCGRAHPRDAAFASPVAWQCCETTHSIAETSCKVCTKPRGDVVRFFAPLPWSCHACGSPKNTPASAECQNCKTVRLGGVSEARGGGFDMKNFFCEVGLRWNCLHCGAKECEGFSCHRCHHVHSAIDDRKVFVWRCDRPPCEAFNPSWSAECSGCKQPRKFSLSPSIDSVEVRAMYRPWQCPCGSKNLPTTVKGCVKCKKLRGLSLCKLCGTEHLLHECPTPEYLEWEKEILAILEETLPAMPAPESMKI